MVIRYLLNESGTGSELPRPLIYSPEPAPHIPDVDVELFCHGNNNGR